jgi:vanillate/3-O-methylgallate O-demethylase
VIGEHPGGDANPEGDFNFKKLKARVAASPFNEHARHEYRRES